MLLVCVYVWYPVCLLPPNNICANFSFLAFFLDHEKLYSINDEYRMGHNYIWIHFCPPLSQFVCIFSHTQKWNQQKKRQKKITHSEMLLFADSLQSSEKYLWAKSGNYARILMHLLNGDAICTIHVLLTLLTFLSAFAVISGGRKKLYPIQ